MNNRTGWNQQNCPSCKAIYRKRLWAGGNFGMARTLFADVDCWLQHMTLDNDTGLDVPGIHLRPATGLEAVDYFVPGYAVWAKLVEALADLGYDSNNLVRTVLLFKSVPHCRPLHETACLQEPPPLSSLSMPPKWLAEISLQTSVLQPPSMKNAQRLWNILGGAGSRYIRLAACNSKP